jgi:arylsulfatase A-like enzyme
MSWAVGEILDTIRELKLEEDTLAIFTSDNGPHRESCEEGGHPGPLKEGKLYYMEGGFRVPAAAWWPGTIAPGQVSLSVLNTMDIFPTFVELSGAPKREDIFLDGKSFASLLQPEVPLNESAPLREDLQYFYCQRTLVAIRYKTYKIYFYKSKYPSAEFLETLCRDGLPLDDFFQTQCPNEKEKLEQWRIFDVEKDISEDWPINVRSIGDVVQNVTALLREHEKTIVKDVGPLIAVELKISSLGPCCNAPYCTCSYISKSV